MAKFKALLPDQYVLHGIFPDLPDVVKDSYTVLTHTFHTCTFRLRLPTSSCPGYPTDLIIRIEKAGNPVGFTTNSDGTDLEYTVIPFVKGSVMLEDVWSGLEPDNQRSLMDAVIGAVERLQQVDAGSMAARQALGSVRTNNDTPSGEITIGGPDAGCHASLKSLLEGVLRNNTTCEITSTAGGLAIHAVYEDVGGVEITHEDFDNLRNSAVPCHKDLKPRNILVRKTQRDNLSSGGPWYELAAITDRGMAGFYPSSYKFGLKDGKLGISRT